MIETMNMNSVVSYLLLETQAKKIKDKKRAILYFPFQLSRLRDLYLQSFTKYLRQTLVFMWNWALREKLSFYF